MSMRLDDLSNDDLVSIVEALAGVLSGFAFALDMPQTRGLSAREIMLRIGAAAPHVPGIRRGAGIFVESLISSLFEPRKRGGHLRLV